MKNVSIVIPNWNGQYLLPQFFPSVLAAAQRYRASTGSDVEIVFVDDASSDESCGWLRAKYGQHSLINLIQLRENVGFLRAVNKGFDGAKYDVVFLLNNDVKVEPDCIEPLADHFEDENVFAVCCRAGRISSHRLDGGGKLARFERGFWRVFLNYDSIDKRTNTELISFFGSGGYTAYDRQKWNDLGGFQDILSPNYWEDVEICYRAWKRGWKVIYEPVAQVFHLGSASMKRKDRGEMNIVTERNRLLMTWLNLHDRRMFASHIGWLLIKLLGSAISLKWNYLRSFGRALGKLSKVRELRRIERNAAVVNDREIAARFEQIVKERGLRVMHNEADEIAFARSKNRLGSQPE